MDSKEEQKTTGDVANSSVASGLPEDNLPKPPTESDVQTTREDGSKEPQEIRWIEQAPENVAEESQPKDDVEKKRKYTFVDSDGEECAEPKPDGDTVKDENGFVYYKCRFCGLTYNYLTTLKAHERVHDIAQPYLCNKCGESFHYMCELEYHSKQHEKQKGYRCECGRTFYQYTDLLYHRHPEDEPIQAPPLPPPTVPLTRAPTIDPSEFPTPDFLEKGFEPKHPLRVYSETRTKPYICQYCSKSYADSRGLAYHMYSHRGERTFNPRASRYLMCRNDNSYISPGVPL